MIAESDARQQLREWVSKNSKKEELGTITDDTNIIENRIITSVQILNLILCVERITGATIDIGILKPGSFRNVSTICKTFFGETNGT